MANNDENKDFKDSFKHAYDSVDFDGLRQNVEDALSFASEAIASGLNQAAGAVSNAVSTASESAQKARREQLDKQQAMQMMSRNKAIMSSRFSSTSSQSVSGVLLIIIGVIITVAFGVSFGSAIDVASAVGGVANIASCIVSGAITAAGASLIWIGSRRTSLASSFRKYKSIIGLRESCQISQLARMTGDTDGQVVSKVKRMINRRLFKQAHLDMNDTHLLLTDSANRRYLNSVATEAEINRKKEEMARAAEKEAAQRNERFSALNPVQIAMLKDGERYINEIRSINAQIPGAEISAKISRIELLTQKILERAAGHPEVINDLQKMMDYYLPTTVKLLETYRDLDMQPIQGETISKSKEEIDSTLDLLNDAFERLLDSIFKDAAWDVSTDITVLQTMLAQEGLIGDELNDAINNYSSSRISIEGISIDDNIGNASDDVR